MSREMKFKFYEKRCGEYELRNSDDYFVSSAGKIYYVDFSDNYIADRSNDMIAMQYTGLKDKSGKDIFENDIVRKTTGSFTIDLNTGFKSGDKIGIFQIKFNQLHCCFGLFDKNGCYVDGLLATEYNDKGKRHKDWRCDDIEVIGNIYENSELINND